MTDRLVGPYDPEALHDRTPADGSPLTSMGYQQLVATSGLAVALTVPLGATAAMILPSAAVRWRDDGVAPTGVVGMPLGATDALFYSGALSAFRVIAVSTTATVDITYYA